MNDDATDAAETAGSRRARFGDDAVELWVRAEVKEQSDLHVGTANAVEKLSSVFGRKKPG